MSKYAPKGIPTPKNSFVRNEIAKFESIEKTDFKEFTYKDFVTKVPKSEKQKYSDWLSDEIAFFKKDVQNYKTTTIAPAKAALTKIETQNNVRPLQVYKYKQASTKLTFYVTPSSYVFALPTKGDWVYIPILSGGDAGRWGAGVVQVLGSNYTSSSINMVLLGDSSSTAVPAWSLVLSVPSSHSDSSATNVTGSLFLVLLVVPNNISGDWQGRAYATHKTVLYDYRIAKNKLKDVNSTLDALKKYLKELEKKAGLGSNTGNGNGNGNPQTNTNTDKVINDSKSPVAYNLPSVKWAYFSNSGTQNSKGESLGYSSILLNTGGSPASSGLVANANQLWSTASKGSHKGMFQTYSYWKSNAKSLNEERKDPNLPTWYLGGSHQSKKYGFQFLYNPGTVQMGWGGTPNVDPGLYMSGKDATPYITPSQTSSWISFDLIVNRMPDMALLNAKGPVGVLENLESIYGLPHSHSETAPGGQQYLEELKTIQSLGTMYDIEYLLSTLIGFREFSALRGRYTADFGFLMGVPVELHLGKQMRYIGTILDFNVTHTIFSEGMIPTFTNISITFSRRIEPFRNSKGKAQIDGNGSLLKPKDSFTSKVDGKRQTFLGEYN